MGSSDTPSPSLLSFVFLISPLVDVKKEVHGNTDSCKDRWTKRGGELGLFQFLKQGKATLTYAILVEHQFTNRITKLPTQAKRDKAK